MATTTEEDIIVSTSTTTTVETSVQEDPFSIEEIGDDIILGDNNPITIGTNLIDAGLGLLGIIFVFIILIAGLKWMTSGGNDDKIKEARKTLFNAIIGIILILSAYSIVTFVFRTFEDAGEVEEIFMAK